MKHSKNDYISDMKFSPSLAGTANHKLKSHNKHTGVKLASLLFAILTLALNVYTFSGKQASSSLASSSNDVFYGGLGSDEQHAKQTLLQSYDNNQNIGGAQERDIQSIIKNFGVSRLDLQMSKLDDICVNCSNKDNLRVLVRNNSSIQSTQQDVVVIDGGRFYSEPLNDFFDDNTNIKTLKIDSDTWIGLDSGNIIFRPDSQLSFEQTLVDETGQPIDKPASDEIRQRIFIKNSGKTQLNNVELTYSLPLNSEIIDYSSSVKADDIIISSENDGQIIRFQWSSIESTQADFYIDIITQTSKTNFCRKVIVSSLQTKQQSSNKCTALQQATNFKDESQLERAPESTPATEAVTKLIKVKLPVNSSPPVKAGDRLTYELSLTNSSDEDVNDYQWPEFDATDILEYASIVGGNNVTVNKGKLIWSGSDIKAGETITKTVEFKLMDTLPDTAQSSSDPSSYDCMLSANYGNTTDTRIACGALKIVEQSSSNLPTLSADNLVYLSVSLFAISLGYYFASVRHGHRLHKARQEWI